MVFRSFEDFLGSIGPETNGKIEEFKQELFAMLGVQESPDALRMYSEAWRTGNAGGLQEVASHFRDLLKIYQEAKVL